MDISTQVIALLRANPNLRYADAAKIFGVQTNEIREIAVQTGLHKERLDRFVGAVVAAMGTLNSADIDTSPENYEPCTEEEELFPQNSSEEVLKAMGQRRKR